MNTTPTTIRQDALNRKNAAMPQAIQAMATASRNLGDDGRLPTWPIGFGSRPGRDDAPGDGVWPPFGVTRPPDPRFLFLRSSAMGER